MARQLTEREELEYLRLIFNNIDNPLFLIDKDGHTLLANNATFKLYRCSKAYFEENYSDSYKMKDEGHYEETVFERVVESRSPVTAWNNLIIPGRRPRQIYVSESPVFDSNGEVRYVVGQDIPREIIEKQYASISYAPEPVGSINITSRKSGDIIYSSQEMARTVKVMSRIAETSAHVLLQGETGTGKDVSARFIHSKSPRADKDMVFFNCAAMSPSLFETEMFGYEGGSFTGASSNGKAGLIETADGSTLFLDEIDSIPLECQGKLLRVLETKRVRRVGSNTPRNVDFRLIVATNKDLEKLVREGKFREDLYYRLNILSVSLPPLRERMDDVRPLAAHFLEDLCRTYGIRKTFSPEVYRELESYDWPGNVRELRNTIERALLTSDLAVTEIRHIPMPEGAGTRTRNGQSGSGDPPYVSPYIYLSPASDKRTGSSISGSSGAPASLEGSGDQPPQANPAATKELPEGSSLGDIIDSYEKNILETALRKYGTLTEAARNLGVSVSTLSRKCDKLGIRIR